MTVILRGLDMACNLLLQHGEFRMVAWSNSYARYAW